MNLSIDLPSTRITKKNCISSVHYLILNFSSHLSKGGKEKTRRKKDNRSRSGDWSSPSPAGLVMNLLSGGMLCPPCRKGQKRQNNGYTLKCRNQRRGQGFRKSTAEFWRDQALISRLSRERGREKGEDEEETRRIKKKPHLAPAMIVWFIGPGRWRDPESWSSGMRCRSLQTETDVSAPPAFQIRPLQDPIDPRSEGGRKKKGLVNTTRRTRRRIRRHRVASE